MTKQDEIVSSLTVWRENRGGGIQGMQSVLNVIMNRAAAHGHSPYTVCTTHAQFSSISMPGPEAYLWPVEADLQWQQALSLASLATSGQLEDLTNGATNYYAPAGMPGNKAPSWTESMTETVTIGGQIFFK